MNDTQRARRKDFRAFGAAGPPGSQLLTMSKRFSKTNRRSKALPALGFAGVSLSMASGACASTSEASANSPPPLQNHEIFLGEEEISDVSLATFYVFDKENAGPLIVLNSVASSIHHKLITDLSARLRLPAIYPYRFFVADGGLVSYGIDNHDLWQKAAGYVDRILKGAKPAELPVQEPTKFELAINLKTAKALGLAIPPSLPARADEVIE
jgi:putative tryptophan/tyrosine transport system substrate-binding protein